MSAGAEIVTLLQLYVRFGSLADMCGAKTDVRSTPESDRNSGHWQTVMSALLLIADMCGATSDVGYGPKADIAKLVDYLVGAQQECL